MKILVAYYSRTGATKTVGLEIAKQMKADSAELLDVKSRKGIIGWLRSGKEASRKNLPEIKPIEKNVLDYDLVIIGSPVWAGTFSSPTRTFLEKHKKDLKKVAFFCTMSGETSQNTFSEMEEVIGKKPVAKIAFRNKLVKDVGYLELVKDFVSAIRKKS